MATITISSSPLLTGGLDPLTWARNGVGPSGSQTRQLGDYVNFLLGWRLRHIATNSFPNTDSPDFASGQNNTTFRIRTHLSPNATAVRIRNLLIPTDASGANYATPKGWWTITDKTTSTVKFDDGSSGTDRSFVYDARVGTVDTDVPNNYAIFDRVYASLVGGNDHTFEFHQKDGLRSIGYSIHEVVRLTLSTTADTVIDAPKFADNTPIYNRDVLDLLTDLDTCWKRMGTQYLAFTVPGTTAKSMTGTTETNLLDGTTTTNGWTTTSDGFYVYPQYHDSEDTRIAATYNIPCVFYVYASTTVAGTGKVSFRWGTAAGNTFASISGIGAEGWYTTTGNLNGNNASDKIDLTGTGTGASSQVNLFAAGVYPRSA